MKYLIFSVLMMGTVCCFAQIETLKKNTPQLPNAQKSYVQFDLFSPFYPGNNRYRLSYIHSLSPTVKLGGTLGYGSINSTPNTSFSQIQRDFEIIEFRAELYYVLNPIQEQNHYISIEPYYINQQSIFENNNFFAQGGFEVRYDRADYTRNKYGANINYGGLIHIGDHVGLNPYIGLGIRARENIYDNLVNPRVSTFFEDESFFGNYFDDEGTRVGVNFNLGLKFHYTF